VEDLPHEIIFSSLEEAEKKVKQLSVTFQECRLKTDRDEVKLKLRTKRTLYTLVFKKENTGAGSPEELKKMATDFATKIGCSSVKEL
jgi:hypothetical protein